MEDEDEVDIVGEFDEVISTPSTCNPYDEMGLNEFLPYLSSNSWLLNTEHVWSLDNSIDDKSKSTITKILQDDREANFAPNVSKDLANVTTSSHKKPWTESEKEMFHKGLKTFGHSWTKISKFIGSRTTLQVKNFARQYLKQVERSAEEVNTSLNHAERHEILSPATTLPEHVFETGSPTVPHIEMKSPRKKLAPDLDSKKSGLKAKNVTIVPSKEIVRIDKESAFSDTEDIDIEDLEDAPKKSLPETAFKLFSAETENVPISEIHSHRTDEKQLVDPFGEKSTQNNNVINCDFSTNGIESETAKNPVNNETKTVPDILDNNGSEDSDDDGNAVRPAEGTFFCEQDCQKSFDFEIPLNEFVLERNTITELEKSVHQEFFEGRPQKTLERYLKIRNYILDSWEKSKPAYLNKTSVRPGLKNCGDVNCIGRIHTYLEQAGAINFGCEQTVYIRPLVLMGRSIPVAKKLSQGSNLVHQFARMETMRPRKRKIPFLKYDSEGGGYTIEHGKDGEVIDIAEGVDVPQPTLKRGKGDDPFRLVLCSEFNPANPAPFSITVHLEALLVMDVHAHLSTLEVIGLLGGHFDQDGNVLHIVTSEPCESLSTGQECEMDPVSQTLASEKLHEEGYSVVGWYHSHPTFAPNPSIRDLDTQAKFQEWFSQGGAPFLGVIISPHLQGAPFSKLRYLIVGKEVVLPDGYRSPFKFTPNIVDGGKDVDKLLVGIVKLVEKWKDGQAASNEPKTPIATLNKMLSSLHHHLSQAQMEQTTLNAVLNEFGKALVTRLIADGWSEPNSDHNSKNADCKNRRDETSSTMAASTSTLEKLIGD